jgi:hypothetical protein
MKASEHADFNMDFPEQFSWWMVNQAELALLGNIIKAHIDLELRQIPEKRVKTPGLRQALIYMADLADI